jgi:hypothetical protein
MRASDMTVGKQYVMQRGPTRKSRKVTLLAKEVPSGTSHRVLVCVEEGTGAGKQIEAPSRSIQPLPGEEPPETRKPRQAASGKMMDAPAGWVPRRGEAVAWTQTLGSRCTVLSVDVEKGVVQIRGKVMGMQEEFDALIIELSPFAFQLTAVPDEEVERRLAGRLPEEHKPRGEELQPGSMPEPVGEPDDDIVDRLVFDRRCVEAYRNRFAKRASLQEAEERLRDELRRAERVRKWHGEYLRFRVAGRFLVILRRRPIPGDLDSSYISGLNIYGQPKRKRKDPARRKAA